MNELVKTLSSGVHQVKLDRCKSIDEIKQCIDREFILINFYETKGGTELGFSIDQNLSRVSGADFDSGVIKVVGNLNLNYVDVRCHAEVNLNSLSGTGHLEVLNGG